MFEKGLNTDVTELAQPEGSYRYMLNGLLTKEYGAVVVERGPASGASIGDGFSIIGDILLHDNSIVLFAADGTNSRIYRYNLDNGINTLLVNDASWTEQLTFSLSSTIVGTFRLDSSNEIVIYWTDDINPPRFLNIDTISSPTDEIPLNELKLFPSVESYPRIFLEELLQTGGVLTTGAYQLAVAYVAEDGTTTNYLTISNPINIVDDLRSGNDNTYDGAIDGTDSNKAIRILIQSIDPSYSKVRIAVIKNQLNVEILPDYILPTGQNFLLITYTGNETAIDGSLEEVIIDNAAYDTAKAMTQSEGVLYMGNLTRSPDIGYQKYANAIEISSTTTPTDTLYRDDTSGENVTTGYKDEDDAYDKRSFRRDEVYAFYIAFMMKNGSMSKAYHIPGRAAADPADAGKAKGSITAASGAPSAVQASYAEIEVDSPIPSQGVFASGAGMEYLSSTPSPGGRYVIEIDLDGPTPVNVGPIAFDGAILSTTQIMQLIVDELNNDVNFAAQFTAIFEASSGPGGTPAFSIQAVDYGTTFNGRLTVPNDVPDAWATDTFLSHADFRSGTSGGTAESTNAPADSVVVTHPSLGDTSFTFTALPGLTSANDVATAYVNELNADSNFATDYTATAIGSTIRIDANTVDLAFNGETATITVNSGVSLTGNPATIDNGKINATDPLGTITIDFGGDFSVISGTINGQDSAVGIANKIYAALIADGNFNADYTATVTGGTKVNITAILSGPGYNRLIDVTGELELGLSITTIGIQGGVDNGTSTENIPYEVADGQIYNEIGTFSGQKQFHFNAGPDPIHNMAYWENENETYPLVDDFDIWTVENGVGSDTGESLQGLNVRHHHFPDFNSYPHYEGHVLSASGHVLGIDVSNVLIPDEIKEQITGWRIYYAKRTTSNKRILDQSLGTPLRYINLRIHQIAYLSDGSTAIPDLQEDSMFMIPFSTMLKRPSLSGVTHTKVVCTTSTDGSSHPDIVAEPALYNAVGLPGQLIDNSIKSVQGIVYVPNDTVTISLEHLGFPNKGDSTEEPSAVYIKLNNAQDTPSTNAFYNYIVNLCQYKTDVYNSFESQELVWTGYQQQDLNATTLTGVFGGDTHICYYAVRYTANVAAENRNLIHELVVESDDNIALRHEGTLGHEIYYPKSTAIQVKSPPLVAPITSVLQYDNYFAYNENYSLLNDLKPTFPFSSGNPTVTDFPTRVIRSQEDSIESGADGFRIFLENDYLDMPKNRGEVTVLAEFSKFLLVHLSRGLFRTKGREELQTDDFRAFLGSGDIFAVRPEESYVSDGGYGGCQHPRSAVVTPFGYFFVDAQTNKVFHLSDRLNEISSLGLRNYFKTVLGSGLGELAVMAAWDPDMRRMIFTADNSFTISYAPEYNAWVSFHSWLPRYLASGLNHLLSVPQTGSIIYTHNNGGFAGRFYGELPAPGFEIQVIANEDPLISKIASVLEVQMISDHDLNGVETDIFFNTYQVENSYQDSTELAIDTTNTRHTKRTWRINAMRDISNIPNGTPTNQEYLYKYRMNDLWHKITLKWNDGTLTDFKLYSIGLLTRPSRR